MWIKAWYFLKEKKHSPKGEKYLSESSHEGESKGESNGEFGGLTRFGMHE